LFLAATSETYIDGYASEFCTNCGIERLNENNIASVKDTSKSLLLEFIFI
jgi:hypothetical protein